MLALALHRCRCVRPRIHPLSHRTSRLIVALDLREIGEDGRNAGTVHTRTQSLESSWQWSNGCVLSVLLVVLLCVYAMCCCCVFHSAFVTRRSEVVSGFEQIPLSSSELYSLYM